MKWRSAGEDQVGVALLSAVPPRRWAFVRRRWSIGSSCLVTSQRSFSSKDIPRISSLNLSRIFRITSTESNFFCVAFRAIPSF